MPRVVKHFEKDEGLFRDQWQRALPSRESPFTLP